MKQKKEGYVSKLAIGLFLVYSFILMLVITSLINLCTTLREDNEKQEEQVKSLSTQLGDTRELMSGTYNSLKRDYDNLYLKYTESLSDNYDLVCQIEDYSNKVFTPVYTYSEEDIQLLAKCAQSEAGTENYKSQRIIVGVILNRLSSDRFPNTIKDVIYQKRGSTPQFSVAYNGRLDSTEVTQETLNNVESVLLCGSDIPDNVLYFYSNKVTENWVNKLSTYREVEGTVFAFGR